MLDESLNNFFETALTGELYKLYLDIISYLESIEYETIQDELLNILYSPIPIEGERDSKSESMVCDEMAAHMWKSIATQLTLCGVEITADTKLKDAYDLAVGILHIGEHEDIASIIAAASSEDGPADQLAEILHLVTTQPADHWVMMFEDVSAQLIKKICGFGTALANTEYQEMEETATYLLKLRLYSEFVSKTERELKMLELVGNVILGGTFETYINSGILNDLFEGNEMGRLALELYGLALMSSDAKDDPPTAVRTVIEKYLSDTTRIVKLNTEIGMVNAAFVKFFQTNSKGLAY